MDETEKKIETALNWLSIKAKQRMQCIDTSHARTVVEILWEGNRAKQVNLTEGTSLKELT